MTTNRYISWAEKLAENQAAHQASQRDILERNANLLAALQDDESLRGFHYSKKDDPAEIPMFDNSFDRPKRNIGNPQCNGNNCKATKELNVYKRKVEGLTQEMRTIKEQHEADISELKKENSELTQTCSEVKRKLQNAEQHALAMTNKIRGAKQCLPPNQEQAFVSMELSYGYMDNELPINDVQIAAMADHIPAEAYKNVGYILGFSDAKLSHFRADNITSMTGTIRSMLWEWKIKEGERATLRRFDELVESIKGDLDLHGMKVAINNLSQNV